MPRETLFISDLHLSATLPLRTELFLQFLATRAREAESLYILGDLFDAYIGDDDNGSPNQEVKGALTALVNSGTNIYFAHGNRDFLIGSRFCQETGARLLDDYSMVDLYGTAALVTHGDLLCTDDIRYQQARRRVRTPEWKLNALSKPLFIRRLYAGWYRLKSRLDKSKNQQDMMDVNDEAVMSAFRSFGVKLLIHGHTHRPKCHEIHSEHGVLIRIVLPEWTDSGWALTWKENGHWQYESIGSPE